MAGKKVLVLHYLPHGDAADAVVAQICEALTQGGHVACDVGVNRDVDELVSAVKTHRADLVFNICETFNADHKLEANVAGILELMGQPFTGSGQVGLILAQDKVLTKMIMAAHGVRAPSYVVFYPDRVELGDARKTRFPLMVKPSSLDASIGISSDSVVRDWEGLLDRVNYVHNELLDTALAEEFIDGREFYVGVLGNRTPTALPVLELVFSGYEKGEAKILTTQGKWDPTSEEFKRTKVVRPQRLSPSLEASIQRVAVQVYRACHIRDYGRVDMRVRRGTPFVLEVNPNPYLERKGELATAAQLAGKDYPALVNEIIELALERSAQPIEAKRP